MDIPEGFETDDLLIQRLREGDPNAFIWLDEHYVPLLQSIAFRILGDRSRAEEVVQDVILHLWNHRIGFSIDVSLSAYFSMAVRYRSFNVLRRDKIERVVTRSAVEKGLALGMGAMPCTPDIALENAEMAQLIGQALSSLPSRAQTIVRLRWEEGMSRPEIAERLGITVSTVSNTLTTMAARVRALLIQVL